MKRLCLILLSATLWGQSHEILRPTADSDAGSSLSTTINGSCSAASYVTSIAEPNWYDNGGLATSTDLALVNVSTTTTACRGRVFNTWAGTTQTYTALTLNMNTKGFCPNAPCGTATVAYSLDGGVTWTNVEHATQWAQTTDTVTLSTSQVLSNIWVAGVDFVPIKSGGTNATTTITGFDVWTDGTYTPPTPTPTPAATPNPPAAMHPVIISKAKQAPGPSFWPVALIWLAGRLW